MCVRVRFEHPRSTDRCSVGACMSTNVSALSSLFGSFSYVAYLQRAGEIPVHRVSCSDPARSCGRCRLTAGTGLRGHIICTKRGFESGDGLPTLEGWRCIMGGKWTRRRVLCRLEARDGRPWDFGLRSSSRRGRRLLAKLIPVQAQWHWYDT